MHFVRPISQLASAVFVGTLLVASAGAYSDEAVKNAEELLEHVKHRIEVGEITRTDVAQAQYHLFAMQYRAGLISKHNYCRQALPVLEARGKGIDEESQLGQRSTRDMVEHRQEYFQLKELCERPVRRPIHLLAGSQKSATRHRR